MAGLIFTGAPATAGAVLTGTDQSVVVIVAIVAVAALGVAWVLARQVLAADEGTEAMKRIAGAVQDGANAYLARQFRTLGVFAGAMVFLLLLLPADTWSQRIGRSAFFLVGAAFSAFTGYIGMRLAVRSNVRVAAAARAATPAADDPTEAGADPDIRGVSHRAMRIAFRTGGVVGMITVGLGLLGASVVVLIYKENARQGAGGLRLRRGPAGHVHARRRRHLHQGRRRRRRPGRQGRAGHPRGRPAQRRHHRGQRRRQRRRLRRYGRRPVRVLRRHPGRRADPGQGRLRRRRPRLPAAGPRRRRDHRGARHLRGVPAPPGPQRDDRDQPGLLHLGRLLPGPGRARGLRLPPRPFRRPQGRPRPRSPRTAATRGCSRWPRSPSGSSWPP